MNSSSHHIDQSLINNLPDIKAFEEEIICSICDGIIVDPIQCIECQNSFCKECLAQWSKKSKTCPCRCSPFETTENKLLKRLLCKIQLNCPNKCGKTIPYEKYFTHINQECSANKNKNDSLSTKDFEDLIMKIALLKLHLLLRKEKQYFKMPEGWTRDQLKRCQVKIEQHAHPLTAMKTDRGGWICDICRAEGKDMTYYCSLCDYDCCLKCQKTEEIKSIFNKIIQMNTPRKK